MSFATTQLNIHGHAGCGKTVMALMVAEGLKSWPPPKGHVFKTVAHIGWDRDAIGALRADGFKVVHALDMAKLASRLRPGEKRDYVESPQEAMEYAIDWLNETADKDAKIQFVVGDTETRRNEYFWAYLMANAAGDTNNARVRQKLYGELLEFERQYQYGVGRCGIPVMINLYHTNVMAQEDGEPAAATAKRMQTQMGSPSVRVVPSIIGGGLKIPTAETAVEGNLVLTSVNGKEKRIFKVDNVDARGKNRFRDKIQGKMELEKFVPVYRQCIAV